MISYIIGFLLIGGFYDFAVSATAICVVAEILVHYHKKKPVWQKKKNYILWLPILTVIWSAVASFWAVDGFENIMGIMRSVFVLLWMYRCFLLEDKEKENILQTIPYLGAAMVFISILSLVHEDLAANFWQARRLGGFFQYSNTCALFLMLGIVILVQRMLQKQEPCRKTAFNKKEDGKHSSNVQVSTKESKEYDLKKNRWQIRIKKFYAKEYVFLFITVALLLLGILLTGSRSVLLLLVLWGIYRAFKVKFLRIPFAIVSVLCLGGAYIYGMVTSDEQNIARIFTLFTSNSTILGRILYDLDAISIAMKHPLGLGYMGYYYIQPAMQSGVYTTRFVHNDLLQLLMDYGFVALLLIGAYLGWQLLKGKQNAWKKELLIIVLIASLMDFHLQYMSIIMLLVLCLDLGERDKMKKQKELKENYLFCAVAIGIFGYLTVAFLAHYLGNQELTLVLFPKYTQAQIQQLNACKDKDEAVVIADTILDHNEYVSDAYHTKVYASAMEGDYMKVIECMEQSLAIKRYDVATYQAYNELLEELIFAYGNMGVHEPVEKLTEYKEKLPQKLAALEEKTHPIAFELRDKPVFKW